MKKIVTLGILMICLLVAVRMTTFANAESIEEVSFVDADDVVDEKNVERGESGIIEDMLNVPTGDIRQWKPVFQGTDDTFPKTHFRLSLPIPICRT